VAVFSSAANRPLQGGKGSSPGFRFAIYALVSGVVMFLDQREHYLDQARYLFQGIAFPVQLAVSSPAKAVTYLQENMQARDVLVAENKRLKDRQLELELQVMRMEALSKENGELRAMKDALPPVADSWMPAEIVLQVDPLRQRVLINRGASNRVFKGQTVIDDAGVLGQTTQVGPWSSEVILITDPEHAIPVQVECPPDTTRKCKDLRTIAEGAGDQTSLVLPFLAANADVQVGDKLVTSGLGGVFPAGYPVARITEVHKDAADPHDKFRAVPFARIATDREVVLVWFRPGHPASPVDEVEGGQLKTGNPAMQPQPAPPHPQSQGKPEAAGAASSSSAPAASSATSSSSAGTAAPAASAAHAAAASSSARSSAPARSSAKPAASGSSSSSTHSSSSSAHSSSSGRHT
jgi:rod shape-determining protein MreC